MKRYLCLGMFMALAFILALPLCSMAQTKLTLEDSTGNRISTPGIKSFAMGTDNNLVILLDQPFNFTDLVPAISIDSLSANCSDPGDGSIAVTYSQAGTFSFRIVSQGATLTAPYLPGGIFDPDTGVYTSWQMASGDEGNYLAVFQADAGGKTSQRVVMIKIVPPGYSLTVHVVGNGCSGCSVTKSPDKPSYTLSPPETVQLTPNAGNGYYFTGWSGDLSGSTNPASLVMNSNKNVTATFQVTPATQYALTVNIRVNGLPTTAAGTVTLSPPEGSYTVGTKITLTASANNGFAFGSWEGVDSVDSNPNIAYVNMPSAAKTVIANFTVSSTPPLSPPAAGAPGSLTNPYKVDRNMPGSNYFVYSGAAGLGDVNIANGTTYFEIDPKAAGCTIQFRVAIKTYNSGDMSITWIIRDRNTGQDMTTYQLPNPFNGQVRSSSTFDFNTKKFIYGITNPGAPSTISIFWEMLLY